MLSEVNSDLLAVYLSASTRCRPALEAYPTSVFGYDLYSFECVPCDTPPVTPGRSWITTHFRMCRSGFDARLGRVITCNKSPHSMRLANDPITDIALLRPQGGDTCLSLKRHSSSPLSLHITSTTTTSPSKQRTHHATRWRVPTIPEHAAVETIVTAARRAIYWCGFVWSLLRRLLKLTRHPRL